LTIRGRNGHTVSGLFVFLLLGLFAVFCTVMVLLGVRAYRGSVSRADQYNEDRILSAYVRSMVRSLDSEGAVSVEKENGLPVISIREEYDGEEYVTRVYSYGGALREWFSGAGRAFDPESGEEICAAGPMEASLTDGVLTVSIENAGGEKIESAIAVCGAARQE